MKKIQLTLVAFTIMLVIVLLYASGYRMFVTVSGSMEPAISRGDVLITSANEKYFIGDIITFQNNGGTVTHEVVAVKNGSEYITKGQANDSPDENTVILEKVIGKVVLTLPYLGLVVLLPKKLYVLIFIWVLSFSIIVLEIKEIICKLRQARA